MPTPVSLAVGLLFGQFTTDPVLAADAALAGILPTLIFFMLFQRTLMQGCHARRSEIALWWT